MRRVRDPIRAPWPIVLALFIAIAGCSDAAPETDSTPTTSRSLPAPDDQSSTTDGTLLEPLNSLQDLGVVVEETIAAPRMSFELDATASLPGSSSPVVASRTGSFDDLTFAGTGTRSFQSEDQAVAELWGTDPFRFVVADNTIWVYNPLGEPPGWGGFDLAEFAEAAGGDPLASVDADSYLSLILASVTEVVEVREDEAGRKTWLVRARADDLVPLIAAGGPAARLIEAGASESGLVSDVWIEQAPNGHVSVVSGSFDEWWTNAISLSGLEGTSSGDTMRFELRLEPFDEPLEPVAPCNNPSSTLEEGLTVLTCIG